MQRTHRRFRLATKYVRAGKLGKVHTVRVTLPVRWDKVEEASFRPTEPPVHLDWERWLGQAPLVPYCSHRCHGFFRRWFEYSGGQLTDWGAHHLDVVLWALGLEHGGPLSVEGTAEMPKRPGEFNTPLAFDLMYQFPGGVTVKVGTHPDNKRCGVRFEGDAGWLEVKRGGLEGSVIGTKESIKTVTGWVFNPFVAQLQQFFACVRDGKRPVSSVQSMHRSSTACHLGNIAVRLGRKLRWDAAKEDCVGDNEASAMLSRAQRSPYGLPA
jgi:myo-inositol 2-dehydrogenase / D-chiro-inositol 1-dehydrogenase